MLQANQSISPFTSKTSPSKSAIERRRKLEPQPHPAQKVEGMGRLAETGSEIFSCTKEMRVALLSDLNHRDIRKRKGDWPGQVYQAKRVSIRRQDVIVGGMGEAK